MLNPRRLPVGAEATPSGGVHFRVWAPRRRAVEAVLKGGQAFRLEPEGNGYFSGTTPHGSHGTLYAYRLDGEGPFPDPSSRFQMEGPHGFSMVVNSDAFRWTDDGWPGLSARGQVIYEMHVGTFTPEGTWEAAASQLPELADLGVTAVEVMPVAEFAGRFGWGYDGVALFAPYHHYGRPDDFRRFVNAAHDNGLGVLLDVVYNHLGPDGNYLVQYSKDYFTTRYTTEWGDPINFDGDNSGPVREFFAANAGYWIDEYHLDGLRLDATQNIYDHSDEHILAVLARRVRQAARGRGTLLVAENEPQQARLVRPPDRGGYGLDMLWNDDFHHSAHVALTAHNDAYYTDYLGRPQEFVACAKWGYLYQGQWYRWQRKRRGTPTFDVPPEAFVTFLDNHDQVANSGRGERCHRLTSPGRYKALTALMLLGPGTPMLFQGQEFAASAPFFYFADHNPDLAKLVKKGRSEFLSQFRALACEEMQKCLPDPADPKTFERCKLDLSERDRHAWAYRLHRDLLRLRRDDPVFSAPRPRGVDGAVLAEGAFVLRYFGDDGDDRLLVVNLGRDVHLNPTPEPLLAPPEGKRWEVLWSSESIPYGACGTPPLDTEENWRVPGEAAVALIGRK
jgi:maltooligosyltrehalose trehalohydrolase